MNLFWECWTVYLTAQSLHNGIHWLNTSDHISVKYDVLCQLNDSIMHVLHVGT